MELDQRMLGFLNQRIKSEYDDRQMRLFFLRVVSSFSVVFCYPSDGSWNDSPLLDWSQGSVIASAGYVDQPRMVSFKGMILAFPVLSSGSEGGKDQHIGVFQLIGGGWRYISRIESATAYENSWPSPYVVGSEVCVAYTYNGKGVKSWPSNDGSIRQRTDMLGNLRTRCSDDAKLWEEPVDVVIPKTAIDFRNGFGGSTQVFWLYGDVLQSDGKYYVGLAKGGRNTKTQILPDTEAYIGVSSSPRFTDLSLIKLPCGGCLVSEEPYIVSIGNSLLAIYRTGNGVVGYSVIEGDKVIKNGFLKYRDGSYLKNPRGPVYLFVNNTGKPIVFFYNSDEVWGGRHRLYFSYGFFSDGEPRFFRAKWILSRFMPNGDVDTDAKLGYISILSKGGRCILSVSDKQSAKSFDLPCSTFLSPPQNYDLFF